MRFFVLIFTAAVFLTGCATDPENNNMDEQVFKGPFRFHLPADPECEKHEVAVMIHGLMHSGVHMYSMARFMASQGYEAYCFDYRTTRGNVREHAEDFRLFLEALARKYPDYPINIVTHSLGSLVTRQALGHLDPGSPEVNKLLTRERIKRIVMLAPPNRGSHIAAVAVKYVPFSLDIMHPLEDLSYGEESPVHNIPVPDGIPIGIIAASMDIAVPRDSTPLENQADYLVMTSAHTFIMMRPKVQRQVLAFFKNAQFERTEE